MNKPATFRSILLVAVFLLTHSLSALGMSKGGPFYVVGRGSAESTQRDFAETSAESAAIWNKIDQMSLSQCKRGATLSWTIPPFMIFSLELNVPNKGCDQVPNYRSAARARIYHFGCEGGALFYEPNGVKELAFGEAHNEWDSKAVAMAAATNALTQAISSQYCNGGRMIAVPQGSRTGSEEDYAIYSWVEYTNRLLDTHRCWYNTEENIGECL